jgi:hypothetical protein
VTGKNCVALRKVQKNNQINKQGIDRDAQTIAMAKTARFEGYLWVSMNIKTRSYDYGEPANIPYAALPK